MHSKGISNATAVKRIGEKTLSARKTVSQSRNCYFLKVTILNPLWHSAKVFVSKIANILTKISHEA